MSLSLRNLLGPPRGFDGGLFLPDHKSVTARRPIETLRPDGPLYVPLRAAADLPTRVTIQPGDLVARGQMLARAANPDSLPVHAPVSGRIESFTQTWSPLDGVIDCAVLLPDGGHDAVAPRVSWADESFVGQLADKGVVCAHPRMPAHRLLMNAVAAGVTSLIVNAMETEPYLSADLRTLVEIPGRIIDMIGETADALGAHRAILALPNRHRRVVKRIQSEAVGRKIDVAPLSDRYPQCHPRLLVKTLLDEEIAPGDGPLSVGALVLPLQTIRAAAEAWLNDRPVTHAIMTVSGSAALHPGVYCVPIGTPVRRLIDHVGTIAPIEQAVWGGPLTGTALARDDAVVTADATALILLSELPHRDPVPCIRCGWCVEDCPVGLDPTELIQLEGETAIRPMQFSHLQACIDCGLCTHVCPASLPIAATIRRTRERAARSLGAQVEVEAK